MTTFPVGAGARTWPWAVGAGTAGPDRLTVRRPLASRSGQARRQGAHPARRELLRRPVGGWRVHDAELVPIRIGEDMPAPSGLVMGWSVTMTAPKLTTRPEAHARSAAKICSSSSSVVSMMIRTPASSGSQVIAWVAASPPSGRRRGASARTAGIQVLDLEAGELRAQSFPQVVLCALGDPARVAGALSAWEVILGSWSGPKMTSAITVRTGSLGMDRSNTVQLLSRPPDCSGDSSSSVRPV